jgi:probable HAF family extracellular repeat protein
VDKRVQALTCLCSSGKLIDIPGVTRIWSGSTSLPVTGTAGHFISNDSQRFGIAFCFSESADGMVGLGSLKAYGSGYSYASGVSADGTIVAGYSESDDGIYQVFMYRAKVVDPTPVNPTPPGTMLDLDNTQVAIVQAAQQQEQMVQSRGTTLVTLLGSELDFVPIARPGLNAGYPAKAMLDMTSGACSPSG